MEALPGGYTPATGPNEQTVLDPGLAVFGDGTIASPALPSWWSQDPRGVYRDPSPLPGTPWFGSNGVAYQFYENWPFGHFLSAVGPPCPLAQSSWPTPNGPTDGSRRARRPVFEAGRLHPERWLPQQFNLSLGTTPGVRYTIHRSADLGRWDALTNFVATSRWLVWQDSTISNHTHYFYKASAQEE